MAAIGWSLQVVALLSACLAALLLLIGALTKRERKLEKVRKSDMPKADEVLKARLAKASAAAQSLATKPEAAKSRRATKANVFVRTGQCAVYLTALLLTACCGIIVYGFIAGDYTLSYVAHYRTEGLLYSIAALWGGRQGSLLFWAWLISLFAAFVASRRGRFSDRLDAAALMVCQLVLAIFIGVLVFSASNNPFVATDPSLLSPSGALVGSAASWGMNILLRHWAMVLHPPALLIGYAGFTVPLGYALAALIVKDTTSTWVKRCNGILMFSVLTLSIGIGLGAIWAYAVLGWGGYWAWDAVENASLLPWLVGIALVHTFTIYRRRNAFKRWAVFSAGLAFAFVILGTFITRSGIVTSVHAFEGDPVSLWLFAALIIVSLAASVLGIIWRYKDFAADDDIESFASRDAAYYFNNVLLIAAAVVIAYMTLSSALPEWLPLGGRSSGAVTFNTIARPVGLVYCAILAVCPLLSWRKTAGRDFFKRVWPAGIVAIVVFGLALWYLMGVMPNYDAALAGGDAAASDLASYGPAWYYHGLAIVSLAIASLVFATSIVSFISDVRRAKSHVGGKVRVGMARIGGLVSHLGVAVILAGLVGSSMYTLKSSASVPTVAGTAVEFQDYTLVYKGYTMGGAAEGTHGTSMTVDFEVRGKSGMYLATISPGIEIDATTGQEKLLPGIFTAPLHDIYLVFNNIDANGNLSVSFEDTPLISFVWAGAILLMAGPALSCLAPRRGVRSIEEGDARDKEPAKA